MLEQLLVQFVLPEFASPHGYLRARACHVLYTFSMVTYQDFSNVQAIMEAVLKCLQDEELPVRAQAAIALRKLLEEQELAQQVAKPFVKDIVESKRDATHRCLGSPVLLYSTTRPNTPGLLFRCRPRR